MDIRTRARISVIISLVLAVTISASIIFTSSEIRNLQEQENLAGMLVTGSYEISHLSNDYLINGGSRARVQWEERYGSLKTIIDQLEPHSTQQEQSIAAIRDYYDNLRTIFLSLPEPQTGGTGSPPFSIGIQQVSWTSLTIQSQGIVFEASYLHESWNEQMRTIQFWNSILVLVLILVFVAIIGINYLFISSRLFRSIQEVQRGTETYSTGVLDYRIPLAPTDEIGRIAEGLSLMAGQLKTVTASRDELNREVEQRKEAEAELRESEEKFRNPVEQSPVGVFLIQDNKIRYANPRLAEMVGYTRDDLLNKSFELMIFSDDLQKVRDEISKQLSGEGGAGSIEVLGVKKDGMIIHLEMYASSMIYQGRPAIYGTIIDITERKLAEEAQRASEIRYRRLFEAAQDGILILDAETGQIVDVNPFLIDMLGFSREQFLGKKIWEIGLFKDIVANKDNFEELQRKEYIRYEDMPLETADGRHIAVEFVSNVYVVNHTRVIQCNIRDITERKRMADQIKESLKEKEVLLREIHHRVKNNMQVISSLLALQAQNIKDDGIRGLFKETQNRIRSIALVHELLYRSDNLDEIEYGAYLKKMFIPLFESYSVDQRKVSMSIEAQAAMITIEKAVPCSLIITELISNSLKHAFPGDRKGTITIRFGLDAEAGTYMLDYGDNGVGIPEGLDAKTSGALGMRLIHGLTKQLQGTIELQRVEGTHFTISFPAEGPQGVK